jgi:hypothetical protein
MTVREDIDGSSQVIRPRNISFAKAWFKTIRLVWATSPFMFA